MQMIHFMIVFNIFRFCIYNLPRFTTKIILNIKINKQIIINKIKNGYDHPVKIKIESLKK